MNNALFAVPKPKNEPVLSYAPGTPERTGLQAMLRKLKADEVEIPAVIDGQRIHTGDTSAMHPPHELQHTLGKFHKTGASEVEAAIEAAMAARKSWSRMPWSERAAIFLRAADLLAGPWRERVNAATMLVQSKTVHQAEIDAACELIDFLRFNASFLQDIYTWQPYSPRGMWNRLEYRPLEGFVFAVTPFNFTAIGGNLPTAPAMAGNTVLWKPASTAVYSSWIVFRVLEEAGMPSGVINFLPGSGRQVGDPALASPHLAGLHFTGSTDTFQGMWRTIGSNIANYRTYPRIVGETGGKDFIVAHASADADAVATAISRGSFEYQGQKCSAASRMYISSSIWPKARETLLDQMAGFRMGSPEDFGNFINAVIDRSAYNSITGYIDRAAASPDVEVLAGGTYSDEVGYFIEPTVLLTSDPMYETMREEIFGPVASIYVFDDDKFEETLDLVNSTSPYALTGSIFADDREVVVKATDVLSDAAGNFYINDKPTGSVVGQQPFGGARASGTNDKAGSSLNMLRWLSARSIKETFVPSHTYTYPFLEKE